MDGKAQIQVWVRNGKMLPTQTRLAEPTALMTILCAFRIAARRKLVVVIRWPMRRILPYGYLASFG